MTSPADRPIVLVSNRGPLSFEVGADGALEARRGAGGLVSGIGPLVAGTDTTWIAAAIGEGDRAAQSRRALDAEGFRTRLLDIEEERYRRFYDVACNEWLWFAHHGLWDRAHEPVFDASWYETWAAYREVNAEFAQAVAEEAPNGAIVLVQDYHLCSVAARLRDLRPDLRCVHFSHTPFAPPAWLAALPEVVVGEVLVGMGANVACGFHTARWAADFAASAGQLVDAPSPRTFVSPLASDPDDIRGVAAGDECAAALRNLEARVGDRLVIGRVDRMELTKNLVRGFLAYDQLLEEHPEHRERVVFVAGAYPSRTAVPAYQAYADEVQQTVDRVNERWATGSWTPILLDVEDDHPASVALLRRADVVLVNPIRDGLNLVASETALVNERDAVLVLSPEAGAWERLHDAVVPVDPFDIPGAAAALQVALTLPTGERRALATRLRELAEARTPEHWLAEQVAAAG